MTPLEAARTTLCQAGALADHEIDLAEVGLALASLEHPTVAPEPYRRHLRTLADEVEADIAGRPSPASPRAALNLRISVLNSVIFGRHGYCGDRDTYDDLQNADLMRVIDRRRGLPVALGILFICTARAQGWTVEGIGFPGHFLVRLHHGSSRAILDPFNEGQVRAPAELRQLLKASAGTNAELGPRHYAAVGNRDILLRLQNNIKSRLLQDGRPEKALTVVERMQLLAPQQPLLWLEAGLLQARLGNLGAAVAALESFGARSDRRHPDAGALLRALRAQLN